MTYLFLLGGLFLGWSFGRNNLSNVFGTAIGTRMVSFGWAAGLAGVFILLGALFSSTSTTDSVLALGQIDSAFGALLVSFAIGLTILLAGECGIPVSIVQCSVGAIVGWHIFFGTENNWSVICEMVAAWFYSPVFAALVAGLCFYMTRYILQRIHIPLLYRDLWVRLLLIVSGIYSAYFLGANNMPAIAGPYLGVDAYSPLFVVLGVGIAIAVGALMADRRVIETVSSGLFPLSPLEGLVVVFSSGVVLYCFSGSGLERLLNFISLPTFPLVPIPSSSVLVGSIVGVGLAKGKSGIQWMALLKVILSWVIVPVISGLICWLILAILIRGGTIL